MQERTYNSFLRTQNLVSKTRHEWWMINTDRERKSGKSVPEEPLGNNYHCEFEFQNTITLTLDKYHQEKYGSVILRAMGKIVPLLFF